MTGVLDSNFVIGLCKGDCFIFLCDVFSSLYVPSSVRIELIDQGKGRAGEAELRDALGKMDITEIYANPQIKQLFRHTLEDADREVLAVGKEKNVDYLLTDDEELKTEALMSGLSTMGVCEFILILKNMGRITAVKPILKQMNKRGYGIERTVYEQTVLEAGESL